MRRKILGFLVFMFLFLGLGVLDVSANEGTVLLQAETGYEGQCYVASVFMDGSYKILATCRNLPTALGAESNRLLLWRENEEGKMAKVGELSRGKLSATVRDKFVRLFVTSESAGSPKVPAGPVLAQGNLNQINFTGGVVSLKITPVPSKTVTGVEDRDLVETVNDGVTESGSKIASIFSGIAKAVGLGFVLLLIVVGVLGFLARRKGL